MENKLIELDELRGSIKEYEADFVDWMSKAEQILHLGDVKGTLNKGEIRLVQLYHELAEGALAISETIRMKIKLLEGEISLKTKLK